MKTILITIGLLLVFIHQLIIPIPFQAQLILLVTGFIVLGIPHGAADILIAKQQAVTENNSFTLGKFLATYVVQILAFGLLLWLFPIPALLLFLSIAAYHFGETDLKQLPSDHWIGKLYIVTYGFLLLFIILICHIEEVAPILSLIAEQREITQMVDSIKNKNQLLLSVLFIAFLIISFLYFSISKNKTTESGNFLIRLAFLLLILYHLPLLLGFTFHFVIWHSSLSLSSIIRYLKQCGSYNRVQLIKHMTVCSSIALAGTAIFITLINTRENGFQMLWYCFATLALLTAPHMLVMHQMYHRLRQPKDQILA